MFTNYKINDIDNFETPEHLIFESKINHNISTLISMVQDVNRLVPHAKTHKSKDILNHLIDKGITRHKTSTINELEILGECEPQELILSYPIASKTKAQRLQKVINKFPKTNYSSIVSSIYHVDLLNDLKGIHGVYIDLDTGMHRTGVSINELDELLDDELYELDIDIYSPCAIGATINNKTIEQLKCKIIAGAANNVLENYVQILNINTLTAINLSNKNIADLTGIRDFSSLINLSV